MTNAPDVTKLTIFIKKSTSPDENLGIDNESTGNNVSIPNLIDNLKVKQDIKDSLKMIYTNLTYEVLGNAKIQEQLKVSKNTATSYIKILTDNNLIEPVKGYGKSKYKFKQ